MEEAFEQGKRFEKLNAIAKGEYEQCSFINCELGDVNLSRYSFADCKFDGCNLSLAKLTQTAFRNVLFTNCKMLGLQFGDCNPFGLSFSFDGCVLDHSSFYKLKLKKTFFKGCRMAEADLTECDLSGAVFEQCDMTLATFDRTILEQADLRSAFNYSIDPENNRVKKAKFSLGGVSGLLYKYDIVVEP